MSRSDETERTGPARIGSVMLKVGTVKGNGAAVLNAAKHNKRTLQAELDGAGRIDPARLHLNEVLFGPATAEEVAELAKSRMAAAGIMKTRKDSVRAVEVVVSLPAGHQVDERSFFNLSVQELAPQFGGIENILSADIHRDEGSTHMHLLMLPLVDGRMSGSDAIGGPPKWKARQDEFHGKVCAPYGFKRPAQALTGSAKVAAVAAVVAEFRRLRDPVMRSPNWPAILACIKANPRGLVELLGIDPAAFTQPKKLRSMTAIFTSKGKGSDKPSTEDRHRPVPVSAATEPFPVYGFPRSPLSLPAGSAPPEPHARHDAASPPDSPILNAENAELKPIPGNVSSALAETDAEADAPVAEPEAALERTTAMQARRWRFVVAPARPSRLLAGAGWAMPRNTIGSVGPASPTIPGRCAVLRNDVDRTPGINACPRLRVETHPP